MDLLERDQIVDDLTAILRSAGSGQGRLVFLGGEAGIGKSSVVHRLAAECRPFARVITGACDPVSTPPPLAPIQELALVSDGPLAEALANRADAIDVPRALLQELTGSRPVLAVIEDAHWADTATLDLLRYVGRRISQARGLLICTYRDEVINQTHPLRTVLGDLATAAHVSRMRVEPLSLDAVRALAEDSPVDPRHLHRVTGGNSFYVTEVIASGGAGVPATVQDAVLARAARLSDEARSALVVAACVGFEVEPWLLQRVAGCGDAIVAELVASGMLVRDGVALRFRHELTRQAILGTPAPEGIRDIHQDILAELAARPEVDRYLARLAHHAEMAEDTEAVIEYAWRAAEQAKSSGSHREEAAQYARTLRFAGNLDPDRRAILLEAHAAAHMVIDKWESAIASRTEALEYWRLTDDQVKIGENLYLLGPAYCAAGQHQDFRGSALEALAVLESSGDTLRLARACVNLAGVHMLSREIDEAVAIGERAIALATEAGDPATLAHALNYTGTARLVNRRPNGREMLEQSLQMAIAHNLPERIAHAYTNLGSGLGELRDYTAAAEYLDLGIAYASEFDLDNLRWYMEAWRATVLFYRGNWADATEEAIRILDERSISAISRIAALHVLGRVRARRGDPDVMPALDEALRLALGSEELQRLGPVRAARAEAAWFRGDLAQAADEARSVLDHAIVIGDRWLIGELVYWLWRSGQAVPVPDLAAEPFALEIAGDWAGAARAWEAIGSPYEQYRAMAASDDPEVLRQAWIGLDRLGARPTANQIADRLRQAGTAPVPRGPRRTTRTNPAELTARELDVLLAACSGLSNAGIADRLFLSRKTVEHHLTSVFTKLRVSNRQQAQERARDLNLVS